MTASLALALMLMPAAGPVGARPDVTTRIDELVANHWKSAGLKSAQPCDDDTFLRRVTLDLVGRIPTYAEARAFAADSASNKRQAVIKRLMQSPEYRQHLGVVLDRMIQLDHAGDNEFIQYLQGAVARRQPWDAMFRDIMLGPWDKPDTKGAKSFLLKRLGKLDDLTNDTARVFFGVDVSCAKCHDHPLVPDWKQDHYYGMASFFNRTAKGKGKNTIQEKKSADVTFTTTKGEKRTAKLMFLSSVQVEADAKKVGRREYLVQTALNDKTFFRRAIVNKFWDYFLGQGVIAPVDQMHSANPPTIPGLLEAVGDDLAAHNFDLDRLVAAIVSSKTYQLASVHPSKDKPRGGDFAMAALRPLTPRQFAQSMVLASGDESYDQAKKPEEIAKKYGELEGRARGLLSHRLLDPRTERFQSSAGEALFMSNHADVQRLLAPSGKSLTARLAEIKNNEEMIDRAVWTILSRPAEKEERGYLAKWAAGRKDRAKAIEQLVWALMTSAEFRFNH